MFISHCDVLSIIIVSLPRMFKFSIYSTVPAKKHAPPIKKNFLNSWSL